MHVCRWSVVTCLAMLWALPAGAQEPPSIGDAADRPGFADSPVLVGRGHVLFESGFTLEQEDNDRTSVRSFTWPQIELHGGVTSWLDLAVIWDGVVSARTRVSAAGQDLDETSTGLDDFRVGLKLRLVRRPRFNSALIGYLNVPVGSALVTRRYAEPFTRLAWSLSLSDRLALSGTGDLKAVREDDDRVRAKPAASVALNGSLTGTLDGFVGLVAEPPDFGSRPSLWAIEVGLVRAIGGRSQIDIWVSRRIAGDPDDWFVSAGFVRRLR